MAFGTQCPLAPRRVTSYPLEPRRWAAPGDTWQALRPGVSIMTLQSDEQVRTPQAQAAGVLPSRLRQPGL